MAVRLAAAALLVRLAAASELAWLLSSSDSNVTCRAEVVAPSARSEAEVALRLDVDEVLRLFWVQSGRHGFNIPDDDREALTRVNTEAEEAVAEHATSGEAGRAATYGEITAVGVRSVARALGLDALEGPPLVFFDLGSGVGKLAAQVWLEFPSVVASTGVELSVQRAATASAAWASLREGGRAAELRAAARALLAGGAAAGGGGATEGLRLVQGSMFDVDLSEATHIYVSSLCFSNQMLQRLVALLAAAAPQLQAVASLRRFPDDVPGFGNAVLVQAQMSWTVRSGGTNNVYIYRRLTHDVGG